MHEKSRKGARSRAEKRARGLLALIPLLVLVCRCTCRDERPPRRPPDASVPPRLKGLGGGSPELARLIREAAGSCEVSSAGRLGTCEGDVKRRLRRGRRLAGLRASVITCCHGLAEEDDRIRRLCASELGRKAHYPSMARAATPELLDCLLAALRHAGARPSVRHVARSAAYVATALRREDRLLRWIAASTPDAATEAVYGALWANGRLRVFNTLARRIRDPKTPVGVRVAVINGFTVGPDLRGEEVKRVCGLVRTLLSHEALAVASAAARCAAQTCPELGDRVLDAAEAQLRRGRFDSVYVSAVRVVERSRSGAESRTPARKRALALLTSVLEDTKLAPATRLAALGKIRWIDQTLGVALARRYASETGADDLRRFAEWILSRQH